MDQIPNEEEEFELMYNDDLELLDEMQDDEMLNVENIETQSKKFAAINNVLNKTQKVNEPMECMVPSPQLSQISFGSALSGPTAVNRKLFGTPAINEPKRISSTPLNKLSDERKQSNKVTPSTSIIIEDEIENVDGQVENALQEIQYLGLNKKRRLEDLFGDINDIELEEYEDPETKKFKKEEQRDLDMISKILEARKRHREQQNPLKKDTVDQLNALNDFKNKNLSYTIPKWPCITLVKDDSERVYVRMHSEIYETQHINEINILTKGFGGLLGEAKEDTWNTARELTVKRLTRNNDVPNNQMESSIQFSVENLTKEQKLWVDKYRPKKYVDLLSDETTNRSLLYWLKMWDKVVFGKEFGKKTVNGKFDGKQLNSFNKRTGKFESTGGWNRKTKQNLNTDLDSYGRPMQKVALLCGPPGLGKTTLAHTIARHAGYTIREMNASDDRNPDAFRLTLENGTQMTSVLNEDRRPNCIILDEIDGAPTQSIDFLIRFIGDNYNVKSKKGKDQKNILKRPIICICNDMYAPALRQLRQVAFVVNFPPTESSRLAERLLEICRKENLRTDLGVLLALADKSGNDVRSCISLLQFFSVTKKNLTLIDVLNANLGQKDRHRDLFGVWKAIFQIQRPQRQLTDKPSNNSLENDQPMITMTNMSIATRVKYVSGVVHMGGDYERLMQGVFENYLAQKMPDPNLDGVVEATNWFCFSDLVQTQIHHVQNYSIYPYLQFGFITWHLLFANLAWPKINFPNKGFEVNQKITTHKMIFTSFRKGLSCDTIGIGTGSIILLETIPLLKRILSPNLRSVSSQLLTTKERHELFQTVRIMADLGLVFTQIKAIDGTYQYSLEPDIDALSTLPDSKGITLTYFGRQLIAREVELEKMRRSVPKTSSKTKIFASASGKNEIKGKSNAKNISPHQQNLPNHLQSLKPKIRQNLKETISKDFFGRICTKSASVGTDGGISDPIVKSPIWYRYKEGFNNAVRKDITMSELL